MLSSNHCEFIINLEPQILSLVLTTLLRGLDVTEDRIVTCSLIVINNIISQLFKWLTKKPRKIGSPERVKDDEEKRKISKYILETHARSFHSMMGTMLDFLMSSDSVSHPQLPLPLLPLILVYEEYFEALRATVLKAHSYNNMVVVARWFNNLMDGVARNLSQTNREKFASNVINFRREVSDGLKINISLVTGDILS